MERIVTDPAGLKVPQQLVGLTDAAGNYIDPRASSTTYTLQAPVTVAVTTGDTQVIPANANRKFLLIQVNGAADVALSFGATPAVLATGPVLAANDLGATYPGGSLTCGHVGAVRAIGRAASSITYVEGI